MSLETVLGNFLGKQAFTQTLNQVIGGKVFGLGALAHAGELGGWVDTNRMDGYTYSQYALQSIDFDQQLLPRVHRRLSGEAYRKRCPQRVFSKRFWSRVPSMQVKKFSSTQVDSCTSKPHGVVHEAQ